MQKSFKSTAILAGILGVLLGWYFIYEENVRPDREKQEEKGKRFVSLESGDVTDVQIERPGADGKPERVTLHKAGKVWSVSEPIEARADEGAVNTLVNAITTAARDRSVGKAPKDLTPFGLDAPSVIVRVRKDSNAEYQELRLGKDTPVGFSLYVQDPATQEVYTTSRSLKNAVDKSLFDLRDKAVLQVVRFNVDEVEIQRRGAKPFIVQKDRSDNWQLVRSQIPANSAEWSKTLTAIVDMKATKFLDRPTALKGFGLDNPQVKVTLSGKKMDEKVQISISKSGASTYVKLADKPTVYMVDQEVLKRADQKVASYRSLNVARFNRFKVEKIRTTSPEGPLTLVKSDKTWKLEGDEKANIDTAKVDKFLTALQDAKLEKYTSTQGKGFKADWSVLLQGKEDKGDSLLLLKLKKQGKRYLADNAAVPLAFEISAKTAKTLTLNKADFLAAEKSAEKPPAEKENKGE